MTIRSGAGLFLALLMGGLAAGCDTTEPEPIEILVPREVSNSDYTQTDTGLRFYDFTTGTGAEADSSSQVEVHFAAWLTNSRLLSNTFDSENPVPVDLQSSNVLAGFAEGITGMRVGGERQLVVPPSLAYGSEGRPASGIPGNATIIYEIELMSVDAP
jgi:FKBP-type peptidyl-prolyl cis-trans isomerase